MTPNDQFECTSGFFIRARQTSCRAFSENFYNLKFQKEEKNQNKFLICRIREINKSQYPTVMLIFFFYVIVTELSLFFFYVSGIHMVQY